MATHHQFISKGNALSEQFEGAATLIAQAYGKQTESYLQHLLGLVRNATGDPFEDTVVQAGLRQLYADVADLGLQLFGPGSIFEGQTMVVMNSMAMNGMDRLVAQGRAQGFVLEQTLLDSDAILDAARSTYELAAKNLGSVDPLRQLITQELVQGNGTAALQEKLLQAGFLTDLKRGKRIYTAEQRAKMMARTEPRRLQELAYQDAARTVEPVMNDRLFKWVSVLAPTSSQDSFDRHGHIMSKAEWETQAWPNDNYVGLPPLRPNDRCSTIFYRREWLDDQAAAAMDAPAGSESRRIIPQSQRDQLKQLQKQKRKRVNIAVKPPKPNPKPKPKATQPKAGPPTFSTVADAQEWARTSGGIAAEGLVDYGGMTVETANQMNAWLQSFVVAGKRPPIRELKASKTKKNWAASYTWGRDRFELYEMNTVAAEARAVASKEAWKDTKANWTARFQALQLQVAKFEAELGKSDPYVKQLKRELKKADRMKHLDQYTTGTTLYHTMVHEYGHRLHDIVTKAMAQAKAGTENVGGYYYRLFGTRWFKELGGSGDMGKNSWKKKNLSPKGKMAASHISDYAMTNTQEYFAEAFTSYIMGEKWRLTDEVIRIIEEALEIERKLAGGA